MTDSQAARSFLQALRYGDGELIKRLAKDDPSLLERRFHDDYLNIDAGAVQIATRWLKPASLHALGELKTDFSRRDNGLSPLEYITGDALPPVEEEDDRIIRYQTASALLDYLPERRDADSPSACFHRIFDDRRELDPSPLVSAFVRHNIPQDVRDAHGRSVAMQALHYIMKADSDAIRNGENFLFNMAAAGIDFSHIAQENLQAHLFPYQREPGGSTQAFILGLPPAEERLKRLRSQTESIFIDLLRGGLDFAPVSFLHRGKVASHVQAVLSVKGLRAFFEHPSWKFSLADSSEQGLASAREKAYDALMPALSATWQHRLAEWRQAEAAVQQWREGRLPQPVDIVQPGGAALTPLMQSVLRHYRLTEILMLPRWQDHDAEKIRFLSVLEPLVPEAQTLLEDLDMPALLRNTAAGKDFNVASIAAQRSARKRQ